MRILAYDVTGGWDLDKYSAQKGHTIRLKTDIPKWQIHSICWTLGNSPSVHSNKKVVNHVFKTQSQEPGEGYVTVKVCVITIHGEEFQACRRILIVPQINCEINFEDYSIGNDTQSIELEGLILCAAPILGNPFDGREYYACGGACVDACPRFEIRCGQIQGTIIKCYGKHTAWATKEIYGGADANTTCIPLYEHDIFNKCGRYPPIKKTFCIIPRNLSLLVTDGKVTIDGLSMAMLPCRASIRWSIYKKSKLIKRFCNHKKTIKYHPTENYSIKAEIMIPHCQTVIVTTGI